MTAIVLASSSKIRRQLLANAGVSVSLVEHEVDEAAVKAEAGDDPRRIARLLAEAKAESVAAKRKQSVVIGADQVLELDGLIFNKPTDLDDARRQLAALAGKAHELHTAFAIVHGEKRVTAQLRSARLTMRKLNDADIDWYLARVGDDALTTVGAYQIEGIGLRLFERIEGDYFTILGLPMISLLTELRRIGALEP